MHGLWEVVRNGGWGALLALFLGSIGFLVALGALVTVLASRRAAFYVGVAALVLAALTSGVGLLGMSTGWHRTQAAVAGVENRALQERVLREGYRESQDSAKVGLGAALLPLLLGAIAALAGAGARRSPPRPAQPWRPLGPPAAPPAGGSGARWAVSGVAVVLALLTSGGALAASMTDPPKGKYDFTQDDADAWSLAEARELVDTHPDDGCDQLDDALQRFWQTGDRKEWPRRFARDPGTLIPDWKTTATTCARRIWDNVAAKGTWTRRAGGTLWVEAAPREWDRDLLLRSPLLVDDALHAEILAAPPPALRSPGDGGLSGELLAGGTTVNGRLPPEVIQRIVRQHMGAIRKCYTEGLRRNPDLAGKVKVRFVIDREGSVSSATSTEHTLPDAAVRACILGAFKSMSFPQPEGGVVTVSYPLSFQST